MAHTPTIKELRERRKELVARNDALREQMEERCVEVAAASYWISQGFDLAERMLGNRILLTTALNLFRRSRGL